MKYKGIVFVFGIPIPESLRQMDSYWEKYFDDLSIDKPRNDEASFHTSRRGEVDIRPIIGNSGKDYVFICPTRPSVLEKWGEKKVKGTIRKRGPLYMPDASITIGLGGCGSYDESHEPGHVLLPEFAENSENLMCKGNLKIRGGYSDKEIQEQLKEILNGRGINASIVPKTLSLADKEEVMAQQEEDKRQRWREGYHGSDMETAWFLGYANRIGKRAGSMLVVYDLPMDRPFEIPLAEENVKKSEKSLEKAVVAAIEYILR